MVWHDRIFALGGVLLACALIPAFFGHISTPWWTAALTGAVLASYGINYLTMHYYRAAALMAVQSALWFVILLKVI